MSTAFNSAITEEEERSEKAKLAIKNFRAMQHSLTSYARAISKRSLVVEVSSGPPRTDGNKIYFRPPIELGDNKKHERLLCEKRDPDTLQMLCDACRIRESILISIYHEIAHIIYGTFEKPTPSDIRESLERSVIDYGTKFSARIKARMDASPSILMKSYLDMAGLISPYMPTMVNFLEDARIDSEMFKARKGTKVMFDALIHEVFSKGVEQDDGSVKLWSSYPLDQQILTGCFIVASGYNYKDWFAPVIEEALKDEKLLELLGKINHARSASDTYRLAFPVLARVRELGFCKLPEEEEEEEQEEEQEQDSSEESSEDANEEEEDSTEEDPDQGPDNGLETEEENDESGEASGSENGTSDENSPEGTGDSEGDEAGSGVEPDGAEQNDSEPEESRDELGEGSSESSSGEEDSSLNSDPIDTGADEGNGGVKVDSLPKISADLSELEKNIRVFGHHEAHVSEMHGDEDDEDEKALDKAIIQGLYFEKPSNEVNGVRIHSYKSPLIENGYDMSSAWRYDISDKNFLSRVGINCDMNITESILGPVLRETRKVFSDNARSKMERNLKSGRISTRVLGKRAWANDPRLFQKKRLPGKKSYAVLIGIDISGSTIGRNIVLAKRAAIAQAEICSRVGIDFAIYAHTANGGAGGYGNELYLDVYEIKAFDSPWDATSKEALSRIGSDSENLDGHGVEFYRKKIERHPATDKIILYYSDGKMPAANYTEELEILQREIKYCKSHGIALMGVGIRTDSPKRHGLETVQVDSDEDLVKVVRHLEGALIRMAR